MDHFQSPRNRGRLDDPDATGMAGVPGQGRYLLLYLQFGQDHPDVKRITKAMFECHGCGVTIACGSALTEIITGHTIEECDRLTSADLVSALDGVPADRGDCPEFAIVALRSVVQQSKVQMNTT